MELNLQSPEVSVRFISYQHSKYIAESLKSVLAQDFQDFQIELTDDCSTDQSIEIIRSFNDPRIHLQVQDHNRGTASTANASLSRCTGKYTACMCSDDIWLPNKLSQQVKFLDTHPEYDAVFTLVDIINEAGRTTVDPIYSSLFATVNKIRSDWLRQFFFQGNSLCIPSVLIRTEVYKSLHGQNPTLSGLSDFDLWVRFSMEHDLYILPETLTLFRVRDLNANESGNYFENRTRNLLEIQHILGHFAEIKDMQLFSQIFPEAKEYGLVSVELIPYFLARIAMDSTASFLQLFGYRLLFEFMQNENIRGRLENEFSFYTSDLHRYSKIIDPFNVQINDVLYSENEQLTTQLSKSRASLERYRQISGDFIWKLTEPLRVVRLRVKKIINHLSRKK